MITNAHPGKPKASLVLSIVVFAAVLIGTIVGRKGGHEPTLPTPAPASPRPVGTPAPSGQAAIPVAHEGTSPRSVLIRDAVTEVNKSTPMMVDGTTQLVNAVGVGDAIVYHYKLLNVRLSKIDPNKVVQLLRPSVKNGVCSNPSTRDGVLGNGITMRYVYHDMYGTYIAAFEVTPRDCGPQ